MFGLYASMTTPCRGQIKYWRMDLAWLGGQKPPRISLAGGNVFRTFREARSRLSQPIFSCHSGFIIPWWAGMVQRGQW
jgi:hypothetical protein